MGAGEPLLNLDLVKKVSNKYLTSLATSMPTKKSVERLVDFVRENPNNPLKVYASVHSFILEQRAKLMPNSVGNLKDMIELLSTMPNMPSTDGHAEKDTSRLVLHYTIIPGKNDSNDDFNAMLDLLESVIFCRRVSWSARRSPPPTISPYPSGARMSADRLSSGRSGSVAM